MQKTGGLAVFAYCIFYYYTSIKNYAHNFVTIWHSFQIMLPGWRDSGSFLWKNIGLGLGEFVNVLVQMPAGSPGSTPRDGR